jgi:hypothetical protein
LLSCLCAQLINMFWALLQMGRRLVLPPEFAAMPTAMAYEEQLQFRDPELGVEGTLLVNLMFPATEGTVTRLMNAWWDVKVRCQPVWVRSWLPAGLAGLAARGSPTYLLSVLVTHLGTVCACVQGGRLNPKEAKLLSAKPNHRAMPVSFRTCLMMRKYWQANLLEALADVK